MSLKPGDVVHLHRLEHKEPKLSVSYAIDRAHSGVFLLLGYADRKDPSTFSPDDALNRLGWVANKPITLPARTETLPTGDVLATERANARNQALRECAKTLQAAGFKVVGYE